MLILLRLLHMFQRWFHSCRCQEGQIQRTLEHLAGMLASSSSMERPQVAYQRHHYGSSPEESGWADRHVADRAAVPYATASRPGGLWTGPQTACASMSWNCWGCTLHSNIFHCDSPANAHLMPDNVRLRVVSAGWCWRYPNRWRLVFTFREPSLFAITLHSTQVQLDFWVI